MKTLIRRFIEALTVFTLIAFFMLWHHDDELLAACSVFYIVAVIFCYLIYKAIENWNVPL